MTNDIAICAKKLSKAYGKRNALNELNLDVRLGELVGLIGSNGAGKTTTLAILSGQLVPNSGSALIGTSDVFNDPMMARRALGYVAQDLLLPGHLTLEELARFVCGVKDVQFNEREFERLLELTSLKDDADRPLKELSHGMQRKAAWVVALLPKPKALLLDEGLAGLDAASSSRLFNEIKDRLDNNEVAVLWTEHDLALIAKAATRAVVLKKGEVSEVVDGDELRALLEKDELDHALEGWTGL